jgi:predicted GIY-YIG superfamily endonuclease
VYIIYSEKSKRHYIGYIENVYARLERHNEGLVIATKNCRPYVLKAFKAFEKEIEARKEEIRLKKQRIVNTLTGL